LFLRLTGPLLIVSPNFGGRNRFAFFSPPAPRIEPVTDVTVSQAIEAIYTSLQNDNEDLDAHIAALKGAMAREGVKEATFETGKLAQPNRQGRKLMQSYFRKKGVAVGFA
jgi:hypothetical protein